MTCSYAQDAFTVKRVIDGGTLLLTNSEYDRLIGVDTPETVHLEQGVKAWDQWREENHEIEPSLFRANPDGAIAPRLFRTKPE
jgi:hypothetical protein